MSLYKIIIADDHKLLSDGIELIIVQNYLGEIVAKAANGKELLQILNSTSADLIILDVNMPTLDGFKTAELVKLRYSHLKILIISQYEGIELVKQFNALGVDGYLPKSFEREDIIEAIKKIKAGQKVFPLLDNLSAVTNKASQYGIVVKETFHLSDRECEIIFLISKGFTTKQIAQKIYLSEYTVETHRKNIGRKTGANNPGAIMKFAIENGIAGSI